MVYPIKPFDEVADPMDLKGFLFKTMREFLLSKGFLPIEQGGLIFYVKRYKSFSVTVTTSEFLDHKYFGVIAIKGLEIGLPEQITEKWFNEFEEINDLI